MATKKQKFFSFFISFLLHVIFFLVLFFNLDFAATSLQVGDNKTIIINSYLFHTIPHSHQSMVVMKQENKSIVLKKSSQAIFNSPMPTQVSSSGVQTQALLALLHDAIQKEQRYPPSAVAMSRQGKVQVGFILLVNGNIENLHLIKSSGTRSLDDAALDAVRNAIPFQGVHRYLSVKKDFNINIIFNLAASSQD